MASDGAALALEDGELDVSDAERERVFNDDEDDGLVDWTDPDDRKHEEAIERSDLRKSTAFPGTQKKMADTKKS